MACCAAWTCLGSASAGGGTACITFFMAENQVGHVFAFLGQHVGVLVSEDEGLGGAVEKFPEHLVPLVGDRRELEVELLAKQYPVEHLQRSGKV